MLDRAYPDGRHREDILTARWRLQLLAEESVGTAARAARRDEDARVARLRRSVRG